MTKAEHRELIAVRKKARKLARQGRTLDGGLTTKVKRSKVETFMRNQYKVG